MKFFWTNWLIILSILLPVSSTFAQTDPIKIEPSNRDSIEVLPRQKKPSTIYSNKRPKTESIPAEKTRHQKLIQADRLYLSGNIEAATILYREAKEPLKPKISVDRLPKAIYRLAQLSPGAKVYWRIYQQGVRENLESKILAPLQLLVEKYPEFIPGHLHYAQALKKYNRSQQALQILGEAVSKYPHETKLLIAKIEADKQAKNWIEASITARQFALLNPQNPQAKQFLTLADRYLEKYKSELNADLTWNAVGNAITGAVGFALTGNLFGPISALQTTVLLLQGESGIGDRYAQNVKEQLPMLKDQEVLNYVRSIGKKLTKFTGRNEFKYEFFVIMDDRINAFALPGGKIFINAGTIMKTNSEAELAGLLAHELSHAVLSHGFQLATEGSLTASVIQFIPYVGGIATDLIVFDYSRDMERQADSFGTRILASSGYAADGMLNLMILLQKEEKKQDNSENPPAWLSTHPEIEERIEDIENSIVQNNYNRYAYEGVLKHDRIKNQVKQRWQKYKQSKEYQQRQREIEDEE